MVGTIWRDRITDALILVERLNGPTVRCRLIETSETLVLRWEPFTQQFERTDESVAAGAGWRTRTSERTWFVLTRTYNPHSNQVVVTLEHSGRSQVRVALPDLLRDYECVLS